MDIYCFIAVSAVTPIDVIDVSEVLESLALLNATPKIVHYGGARSYQKPNILISQAYVKQRLPHLFSEDAPLQ